MTETYRLTPAPLDLDEIENRRCGDLYRGEGHAELHDLIDDLVAEVRRQRALVHFNAQPTAAAVGNADPDAIPKDRLDQIDTKAAAAGAYNCWLSGGTVQALVADIRRLSAAMEEGRITASALAHALVRRLNNAHESLGHTDRLPEEMDLAGVVGRALRATDDLVAEIERLRAENTALRGMHESAQEHGAAVDVANSNALAAQAEVRRLRAVADTHAGAAAMAGAEVEELHAEVDRLRLGTHDRFRDDLSDLGQVARREYERGRREERERVIAEIDRAAEAIDSFDLAILRRDVVGAFRDLAKRIAAGAHWTKEET